MSVEKMFTGKAAFVTGAGSGLGRACAIAFATAGASVKVADIDAAGAQSTVEEIVRAGGVASFVQCDVSRETEVAAAVESCVTDYGGIDAAVNSAGIIDPEPAPMAESVVAGFDRVIAINLRGVYLSLRYQLAVMVGQGAGAIVNISSDAGLVGVYDMAGYSASKHGVLGLTKAAALDYARKGIRVNAICPGVIETPINRDLSPELMEPVIAGHPMGRIGRPQEIADAAVWLCSPAASFATGVSLPIDGGYVIR
ncbi:glucose 1-dehydrogenase [Nocardia sp. R6R-6]|uniref:glucose 1-dehydrogenase n=1 Tax=Nocardia sp. R6R-6 TaxID=3459303 RepID=UPI00403DBF31